ncbi:MAG TPA: ATP-binding protein [Candidatus Limnocylindria bacterium]|nr:ATP-binding protein [Candidatus Limnocylindria bacterium]
MIQVIHGRKGSGKTKRIIDMANDAIKDQKGDVIFVDDDNRYMFDLRHEIRFVNAGEYGMSGPDMFFGFLCGMLAQNFDVSVIFIDAFLKLVRVGLGETERFFAALESLAEKRGIRFVLSVSADDAEAPEYIRKYFI